MGAGLWLLMRSDLDIFEHHPQQNNLVLHVSELRLTVRSLKNEQMVACRAKNHWAWAVTNVRPHANKVLIVAGE